ncbi:PD-(D/E)XK nuclease family protein [Nesterenkonia alba]|uniref:PD-(D/E)XK nuclease family protein n=1 Tax=Nesterenkonia alba TaxID=515814 RepID=UPI0003B4B3CA|nr:PD-(D/E)XK nuclease family protein [Nesterenkonia alba]
MSTVQQAAELPTSRVDWDAEQRRVRSLPGSGTGPALVYGGPGSGKTWLTVRLAADFITAGHDASRLLVLSPTRTSAARLRRGLERTLAAEDGDHTHFTAQPSRSFSAWAFWILNQAREFQVEQATLAPRLLSGAEQDRVISEVLASLADTVDLDSEEWAPLAGALEAPRALRKQIRTFIDRCREYQVTAEQLQRHGLDPQALPGVHRPEWRALGTVLTAYETYLAEQMPGVYDSTALLAEAERLLQLPAAVPQAGDTGQQPLVDILRQRLDLILVDDLQEAPPSVYRLLAQLGAGGPVIAFANPSVTVQGFRGARPDKLANWTKQVADPSSPDAVGSMVARPETGLPQPVVLSLPRSYRMAGDAADLYTATVARTGAVVSLQASGAPSFPDHEEHSGTRITTDTCPTEVAATVLSSQHLADRKILQEVLQARAAGAGWDQIAVIVRGTERIDRLHRLFTQHSVEVTRELSDLVLHREEAVWPLLSLMAAGSGEPHRVLSLQQALDLLASVYAGAEARRVRGIRQALLQITRRLETEGTVVDPEPLPGPEEHSRSDHLLVAALRLDPGVEPVFERIAETQPASVLDKAERLWRGTLEPLLRLRRMLRAAVEAQQVSHGASAEEVLWAVWEAADVAEDWQQIALSDHEDAQRADANLDAVMAAFQTARRFLGQQQGNEALAFVDYVEELELPMDGLVDAGTAHTGVEILTPATAAGRQFHTAILTDLQDGTWPLVRPQGELLGSSDLVAVVEAAGDRPMTDVLSKRQEALIDEYRVFASAVSRATHRVALVAVQSDDQVPSSLYDLHHPPVTEGPAGERVERVPQVRVPQLVEGRALAAGLRTRLERELLRENPDPGTVESVARELAVLAQSGIPGAHPDSWWGVRELSSTAAVFDPDDVVPISPSSVADARDQPLKWFTSAAGGTPPSPYAADLGTFIHMIAEKYPEASTAELLDALDTEWEAFRAGDTWADEQNKAEAAELLEVLGGYYDRLKGLHTPNPEDLLPRKAWIDEQFLRLQIPVQIAGTERLVELRGKADRIEILDDGRVYVVDIKTTKRIPSNDEVRTEYPQIGLYQLMLAAGALESTLRRMVEDLTARLEEGTVEEPQREQLSRRRAQALDRLHRIGADISDLDPSGEFTAHLSSRAEKPIDPTRVAGAALLQLRRKWPEKVTGRTKNFPTQPQAPLPVPEQPHTETPGEEWWRSTWAMHHVEAAAQAMTGTSFRAQHEPGTGGPFSTCYVGVLCPLCAENTPVVQREWEETA